MNSILTLRLLTCLCAALLPTLFPSDALAQRTLVPLVCNPEPEGAITHMICNDVYVEAGTIPPDSCYPILFPSGSRDGRRDLMYSDFPVHMDYYLSVEHADEFRELSKGRAGLGKSVIDSSKQYLLAAEAKAFLRILSDSIGYDSVTADYVSRYSDGAGCTLYSVSINGLHDYYNLGAMHRWWREAEKFADVSACNTIPPAYFQPHFSVGCAFTVSAGRESSIVREAESSANGVIRIENVHGPYIVLDVNGRTMGNGLMQLGEPARTVHVHPGVYFVQTAVSIRQILVLP